MIGRVQAVVDGSRSASERTERVGVGGVGRHEADIGPRGAAAAATHEGDVIAAVGQQRGSGGADGTGPDDEVVGHGDALSSDTLVLRAVLSDCCLWQGKSRAVLTIVATALEGGQGFSMPKTRAGGVRARARGQMTEEVVAVARRHLAEQGAAGLSLRAVARDLGMVSSAVYRYVPSRDALLTLLIVRGYDALGDAVERADSTRRRGDIRGRWRSVCSATRGWASENPQEWGLVYGSPVPGYAAPQDTVGPASRLPRVLSAILSEAVARGCVDVPPARSPRRLRTLIAPVRSMIGGDVPDEATARMVMAYSHLVGAVSFELGGHLVNGVTDQDAWFTEQVQRLADFVGLR